MSQIDSYKHRLLGFTSCPTDYPQLLVHRSPGPIHIALYVLKEDIAEWHAKKGDLLLGGGRGECPAFRISLPETIQFFTDQPVEFDNRSDLYTSYWRPEAAFAFCNGFLKLGWRIEADIETWLTERALAFVLENYPQLFGTVDAAQHFDGIRHGFRLPYDNERPA